MSWISININEDVDVNISDIFEKLDTQDLIKELQKREVSVSGAITLDFEEWELIEAICKNKNLIEADKIRSFFNQ